MFQKLNSCGEIRYYLVVSRISFPHCIRTNPNLSKNNVDSFNRNRPDVRLPSCRSSEVSGFLSTPLMFSPNTDIPISLPLLKFFLHLTVRPS